MSKMIGLAAAAAVLMLVTGSRTTASAQAVLPCTAPECFYSLGYYSNAHVTGAPDGTLRLVNDGFVADSSPAGDLCAAIYVFDANEELNECCSCKITPNGLLTLSVNALTSNTVTHKTPSRGVIKVLSTPPFPTQTSPCDPTGTGHGNVALTPGIHGWITHIQRAGATFPQTEEELTDATTSNPEVPDLVEDCMVAIELGSGQGVCDCTDAGR